jgi:undecaprenyl-diphosphatase
MQHQPRTAPAKALRDLDAGVEKAVKPYRRELPVRALALYGKVGDQPPLLALSGGVLALGLLRADGRLAKAGANMVAAHLLATGMKSFLKHRIDRKRPRNADGPADNEARSGSSRAKAKSSFPSGHSAGAIAVARAFGREYPEYRPAAMSAAALVAVSQIARSAHFATDVLAGAFIGWSSEALVNLAWKAAPHLAQASDSVSSRRGTSPDRQASPELPTRASEPEAAPRAVAPRAPATHTN